MYRDDVPIIAAHGWSSPSGLQDIIEFTLGTIQQTLQTVALFRADVALEGRAEAPMAWGMKRQGLEYLEKHGIDLWWTLVRNRRLWTEYPEYAIHHLLQVPGLGLAKAAFVAQMLGLDTACLDRHNLTALGLEEREFKLRKGLTPEAIMARIRVYQHVIQSHTPEGVTPSEYWWDRWCAFVAGRRGSPLKTAEEVSRWHRDVILMWEPGEQSVCECSSSLGPSTSLPAHVGEESRVSEVV